ncbi:hypothetical protein [Bradyrhizobium sp. Tv2a-2]|uniref:hypothetical protein n=1 Tax=Bradyrhizobium sp. Tv2a-2 TaxID=113395 RepID=UPI0012EB40ED|nr:hypothetical protein [Bradyrhizobium sp. Tv2a-2]
MNPIAFPRMNLDMLAAAVDAQKPQPRDVARYVVLSLNIDGALIRESLIKSWKPT